MAWRVWRGVVCKGLLPDSDAGQVNIEGACGPPLTTRAKYAECRAIARNDSDCPALMSRNGAK
eukprot:11185559-Lingulodinium_polyedra.AAC.1